VAFSNTGRTAQSVLIPPLSGSQILGNRPPTAVAPRSQADFAALIDRTSVLLGLCQCLNERGTMLKTSCLGSADICKKECNSPRYSFLPTAPESCTR
jgi:hypothetical protein